MQEQEARAWRSRSTERLADPVAWARFNSTQWAGLQRDGLQFQSKAKSGLHRPAHIHRLKPDMLCNTMPTLPTSCPRSYLGVEIVCTLPTAAFWPEACWSREADTYEAYPQPQQRVAGRTLTEIRSEIRRALREG